ncbi:MAG: OmpA family protein [Saccharofermentans sp.]|nr:OmpA family protein [Saccharofermentans sp.]
MKKLLKMTSLFLVASMLLTACSSKDDKNDRDDRDRDREIEETEDIEESEVEETSVVHVDSGEYVYDHDYYSGDFYIEAAPSYLNNYYSNLDLSARLIAGEYSLSYTPTNDYSEDDYIANSVWLDPSDFFGTDTFTDEFSDIDFSFYTYVSALPTEIDSGAGYNLGLIDDYDFCRVYYSVAYDEDDVNSYDSLGEIMLYAVQEIHGNQLTLKFLSEYSVGDNGVVTYQFTGEEATYDVTLNYGQMNLAYDDSEVLLSRFHYETDSDYNFFGDSLSTNSDPIDNITSLYFSFNSDDRSDDYFYVYCDENGIEERYEGIARLTEDGVLSFAYTDNDGVDHTYHYILIKFDSDGFALVNENGVSIFAAWYDSYIEERNAEGGYVGFNVLPGDDNRLSGLTREEIEVLNEATERFFGDLETAFNDEGLAVTIDRDSGAIILDASVLFDNNQYSINSAGQSLLNSFMETVLSVLSNEQYDMLLSQIVIQGHTDSNGTYDHNVELSENRANAVMDYLVSALVNNTSYEADYLSSILMAEGCASDFLIYNDDGSENQAASRRVEFVFYVNLDYVNQ